MSYEQVEDLYPLSPMQQGMLFSSLLAPQSGVYIEQRLCSLHGALNVSAFERAWQQVADRHPVMRTSFVWEGIDEPVQIVHTHAELPLEQQDWRGIEPSQQRSQLEEFLKADRRRGFDLPAAPLARLTLLRMAEDRYQFIWTYHHLLMDGWSGPLLVKEVFEFYGAFCRNEYLSLPLPRPYRDYIAWIQQQDVAEAERFWRETLKGFDAPVVLNIKRRTSELRLDEGASGTLRVRLTSEETAVISAMLREHELTLNTLIQGAWALLLSRYSGARDVVFGAVVSGRPPELPGVEQMVGLFINTLPVRVQVSPRATALSHLEKIQAHQFELQNYEFSSLVQVHGWSEVPRGVPLYESILVFENYPFDVPEEEQRETVSSAGSDHSLEARNFRFEEEVNYSLSLTIIPGRELAFRLIYDRRRFSDDSISRMMGHFEHLLEEVVRRPEQPLSSLSLLSRAEEQQLVYEWNETAQALPGPQCLHELVMAQAERTPDAIALINSAGEQFSYRELDQRSNQLARYLRGLGVGPEVRVGLCLQRGERLVLGLLGILKAGGGYVALDAQYPLARLEQMLEDAGVAVVVTEEALLDVLPAHWAQVVSVDGEWSEIERESAAPIESGVSGENLAYVIYTSGSTGQPKGVLVTHSALVNFTLSDAHHFGMDASDRLLQFLSPSFDAFGEELYPTLCSGATLVMHRHPTELSPRALLDFCEQHGVTTLHIPPVYINQMLKELAQSGRRLPEQIKLLITGGESVTSETVRQFREAGGERARILHVYGPSETTVTATLWEAGEGEVGGRVAIGRPLWNVQVYVVDQDEELVPVGVVGELYIGGAGVARGYEREAAQTAERFVPDRWSGVAGGRVYRSGDLVRYRVSGELEFVGRRDEQVKVHGYRIELGEIEVALGELEGVRDAVVLLREDVPNEKRLVAYIVPADESAIDVGELRERLKKRLPLYMIPTCVMLESLPMTASNKVDRQALPLPEDFTQSAAHKYVAPRTPVEEMLAGIWAEVLGVERVGIHDDFFQLGGHSLLATQIISKVREALQTEVPFNTLFDSPTVAGLAQSLAQDQVEVESDVDMEEMLTELESLSEDDIKMLLEMESAQREKS